MGKPTVTYSNLFTILESWSSPYPKVFKLKESPNPFVKFFNAFTNPTSSILLSMPIDNNKA